jgi:hypothetical protein
MPDPSPQKGHAGGECGRLLCRCKPACYYSFERGDYLCDGCAADENRRSWLNRPDGTPACALTEEAPKADDRERQIEAALAVFDLLHERMSGWRRFM